MSNADWDWTALDATQRIRMASYEMEFLPSMREETLAPQTWGWGAALLEFIATGNQPLVERFTEMNMDILTSNIWTPTEEKRNGFASDQKLIVFALEMLAATRGETIDWDSYGIPADRFWLECARTGLTEPDNKKCIQWMKSLCEAHVESSNVAGDSGGTDVYDGHEIDDPAHFLWPITVHAFIKLRRQLGLEIPQDIDHPLMRTSFAPFIDRNHTEKLWQAEPWFIEIYEIAVSLEPELETIRDLVI